MVELSSFVLLFVLMPVSVPLSYKCAVYFLIKNAHFILGPVKVAEWRPPFAIYMKLLSRLITMICKISMLFCVVFFFQFVISASKFSRSPYLDNHLSESTHTWTIGTL